MRFFVRTGDLIGQESTSIPGVGPVKRKALMKRFGSVKRVAAASVEKLSGTPGISTELAQELLRELQ